MKNLIFDFDGVIGDTWEAVIHGLIKSGREKDAKAAISNMNAYKIKKPFHAKDNTLTDKQLAAEYEWVTNFGNIVNKHGFNLFSDFVTNIEQLEKKRIAIVSSGSQNYVLPAVSKTSLEPTHVLAFEDHHSKEEKIDMVCQDWDIPVSEAYYFTDTLADVYELKEHITLDKLIGVTWGYCTKEQLLTELPDTNILETADDLPKLFK